MIAPIIGLVLFVLIVGGITMLLNQAEKVKYEKILTDVGDKIKISHPGVRCSTFGSGAKNSNYIFNRCDLYLTDDAAIIFGYTPLGQFKLLRSPIILTASQARYLRFSLLSTVIAPGKLNVNSFNNEVFIEFGEAGWRTTNVEIRMKELSNEEKELIAIIGKGVGSYRNLG